MRLEDGSRFELTSKWRENSILISTLHSVHALTSFKRGRLVFCAGAFAMSDEEGNEQEYHE